MKLTIKIISVVVGLLVVAGLLLVLQRDAKYFCQRASAKMAKGDICGALADFDRAIKLNTNYVDAYIGRGSAKYKKSDPEGALEDYNKAIGLKPDLNEMPDLSQAAGPIVTNEIAKQALALLGTKDYDTLDALAAKLRSSKERYADGVWKLTSFYDGLIPADNASDGDWDARLTAVEYWALARPASITPRVAQADILVAYAWKARGAGLADTVSNDGWRLFGQRLVEAAAVLREAKDLKEQCPLYWRVMMRDALGLQASQAQFNQIFAEAIQSEPDFEGYYYRRVIHLLPRWYGIEGEWQSDLIKSADKIGGENGDMLYAQVIWNMNQPAYFENPFLENNVSWTRVDKGFEVIEKHFPDSLAAKIERAKFAILFNDSQAAIYYESGNNQLRGGDWAGAIKYYDKAIELKSNFPQAYGNRGNAKRNKGDYDGALADYNRAIEIKPDYAFVYFNRALTKMAKGDKDGALADLNMAIEFRPDFAQAYSARGGLRQAKGDKNGATDDFNQAARLTRAGR